MRRQLVGGEAIRKVQPWRRVQPGVPRKRARRAGCRKRDRSKRYGRVLGSMRVMRSTSLNLVNKGTYS